MKSAVFGSEAAVALGTQVLITSRQARHIVHIQADQRTSHGAHHHRPGIHFQQECTYQETKKENEDFIPTFFIQTRGKVRLLNTITDLKASVPWSQGTGPQGDRGDGLTTVRLTT